MSELKEGVVCVIRDLQNRILLLNRATAPFGWGLPGGKIDPGETKEEAIVREISEEIGFNINATDLTYRGTAESWFKKDGKDSGMTIHVFESDLKINSNACHIVISEREHTEFKWMTDYENINLAGNTLGFINLAKLIDYETEVIRFYKESVNGYERILQWLDRDFVVSAIKIMWSCYDFQVEYENLKEKGLIEEEYKEED